MTDAALLQKCFAGDVLGWEALYDLCQMPLQAAIRSQLGRRARDRDLLEELTAQVWYALVDQNAALLAGFRPDRNCRLTTFVAAVAKNLTRNFLRSERRRRTREAGVASQRTEFQSSESARLSLVAEELRATLSARESGFFDWCLADSPARKDTFSGSENADHQLRFRLRKKVRTYFDGAR